MAVAFRRSARSSGGARLLEALVLNGYQSVTPLKVVYAGFPVVSLGKFISFLRVSTGQVRQERLGIGGSVQDRCSTSRAAATPPEISSYWFDRTAPFFCLIENARPAWDVKVELRCYNCDGTRGRRSSDRRDHREIVVVPIAPKPMGINLGLGSRDSEMDGSDVYRDQYWAKDRPPFASGP
jgi:hypothetical protein